MANYEDVLAEEHRTRMRSMRSISQYGGSVFTIAYKSEDSFEDSLLSPPKATTVCIDGQDIWDIKSLHFDKVSEQTASGALKDLAESKRKAYYQAVEDMKKELDEVRCATEKSFRDDSEYVIAELENIKSSLQEKLQELVAKDISKVHAEEFNNMDLYIQHSVQRHFKTVQNYYEDILDNECQRNKKMKAAFKKCYTTINGIYFKEPEGLQAYFETLIQRANQTTLCNQQSYSELYANLMAQGKVQEKLARAKLADLKRECEAWELEQLYSKIREMQIAGASEGDYDGDKEAEAIVDSITSAEEMIEKLMSLHEVSVSLENQPTEILTDGVQDVALFIDSRAKQILDMYKSAVQNIHAGIHESDGEPKLDNCLSMKKIRNLKDSLQTSLMPKIEKAGGADAAKHPWGHAVQTMEKNLEGFYGFLESAMKVWDAHFCRIKDSQGKMLDILKSQIEKNDSVIDEKEIKLSKVLNALRQENTEEKLIVNLQSVSDILEEIKILHEQNCQSEASCIAEYKNYVDPLSSSLAVEIKTLLKSNPPQKKNAFAYSLKAPSANTEVSSLPRIMRLCEMQISALENWKYGLWIAMLQYRRRCSSVMNRMACNWIQTQIKKAQKRLEAKLSVHNTRYDHIVSEIYNIRLVELRLHSQRFEEHKEGVTIVLDDLHSQLDQLVSKLNEELVNLKTSLEEDEQAAKQFKQSGLAYSKMGQLQSLANTYSKTINKAMEDFLAECETKLNVLHDSNVKYMESIKFFSEGGNFTTEEARKYTVELGELDKMINKRIKDTEREAIKKKNGLNQEGKVQIEWRIEIMKKIGDELKFSEKSAEVLKTAQTKIKGEVFELKYKSQVLTDTAEELLSSIPFYSETHQPLSEICEKWQCLIEKDIRVRDYLLQPSSQVKDEKGTASCKMPLKFISHIDTTGAKAVAPSTVKTKNFKDYREFLFGVKVLPTDSSFMSNICAVLLKALSELQRLSCEFYSKRTFHSIIMPDITQPRHDMFMKKMLIKLKYYHVQCEDVWMLHVQDYLNMVTRLKQAVNDYGPACIEDAHSKNMNTLTKIAEKCTSTLEQVTETHFDNFRMKFKLLLGYPRNDEILEDLDESALASYNALKTNVSEITSNYRIKMVEEGESHSSSLLSLQNSVHSIIEAVFDPAVTEIMMQQVIALEQYIPPSASKEIAVEKTEADEKKVQKGKETLDNTESETTKSTKGSKKGKGKAKAKGKKGKNKKEKTTEKEKHSTGKKGKEGKAAIKEDAPQDIQVDIDRWNIPEEDKIEMSTKALCAELNDMNAITLTSIGLSHGVCTRSKFRTLDLSCKYKKVSLQPCLESIEDEQIDSLIQEYKDMVESFERSAEMQAACYMKTTEEWLRVWKLNMKQAKEYDID